MEFLKQIAVLFIHLLCAVSKNLKLGKEEKHYIKKWNETFVSSDILSEQEKNLAAEYYNTTKSDFNKDWKDLTDEAKQKYYMSYAKEYNIIDEDVVTFEEFMNDNYFETYWDTYTTPKGEEVVAFGYYGHD